jgi:hypothetical protein
MRIHFWNTFFSLLLLVLVFVGFSWLFDRGQVFYDIPLRDLILLSLAVFRLIRLFTYDIITQFIRDWFVGARPDTLPHTLGALINCPWCTGLWFSFVVLFGYFATPYSWPVILMLAIAALGSFLQLIANSVGWGAELKKRDAQKD